MNAFRVAALCVIAFAGGVASFAVGSYLWLERAWHH